MEYKELAMLFHMDTSSERYSANEAEYEHRKAMDSTFHIQVFADSDELFIAMPREMSVLMEKVLRAERKSSSMMRSIPPIGQAALIRGLVLDEVVSTNAIENIHSTRQQIEKALETNRDDDLNFRRFKELALLYTGLANNDTLEIPQEPKDIRAIYDVLMEGELSEKEKPDGKLFRKEGVDINAGNAKVIHQGVTPESKIIEGLDSMLDLVKRTDIPELISAIASHYLFEYIHPFYEGNGRTGRYLLALFLSEVLSTPTVLSLSRAISERKTVYYSAFSSVEDPLNHGELTHFVYSMLELVRIAQSTTMERLQKSINSFKTVKERCTDFFAQHNLSNQEQDLIFVLAQYDLFGMVGSLRWDELAEIINLGKQTTRKHLKALEEKNMVKIVERRPLKFALTDTAEKALGIEV